MLSFNTPILAGDIGGTNARFGLLTKDTAGKWQVYNFLKIKCSNYSSFESALRYYLDSVETTPTHAAFCVAGPVNDGHADLTNSDWQINSKQIVDAFGFERFGLYNDFTGMSRSVPELSRNEFTVIRSGQARKDEPILVAGPGTGFGVGYLVPTRNGWHTIPSEGGHMAYSPQSKIEFELTRLLLRDRDYVSLELVSSGNGLPVVHKAICEIFSQVYEHTEPDKIRERAKAGDAVSIEVCSIRAAATMGAIGDLALIGGTRGGIVMAGGVSLRMIDFFIEPLAFNRFLQKGSHSDFLLEIPIRLLKCPLSPLIGCAALLADESLKSKIRPAHHRAMTEDK